MIQTYSPSYNTDIMFLSETFLDFSIEATDPNINIPGYNWLHSDHPSDTIWDGVCVWLPTRYLTWWSVCFNKMYCYWDKIRKKINIFTCNCRSPSQTLDEFENYCQNFHLTLSNIDDTSPFCSIFIVNFNRRLGGTGGEEM